MAAIYKCTNTTTTGSTLPWRNIICKYDYMIVNAKVEA